MPPRSKAKAMSIRRPLKDVGNNIDARRFAKSAVNPKKPIAGDGDSDALDKLLLLQSDISGILRQVDELVVQAFQLNSTGKQEVESFSHVLSEMLSLLKPWVPRFQKVVSSNSLEPKSQNEQPESPDKGNTSTLISPSPLVSWRANCTTKENGRQLFLLTPLPISKGLSTRHREPPKSVFERVTSEPPRNLFQQLNPLPMDSKPGLASEASTPMVVSKRNRSIVIMTPCLKRSPPKSCILLEEFTEPLTRGRRSEAQRLTTACPVEEVKYVDSESSSSGGETPEDLAFKYPELKGIQNARKSVVAKKRIEDSPDWFRSPPKSCVLLEPSNNETICQQDKLVESTPFQKEPQSTCRRGNRPGENTLKKELWTKFEAASFSDLRSCVSVVPGEASQKGFLDRLDEVSSDEEIHN